MDPFGEQDRGGWLFAWMRRRRASRELGRKQLFVGASAASGDVDARLLTHLADQAGWRLGAPLNVAPNASFAVLGRRSRTLYVVDETYEGALSAHSVAPGRGWAAVSRSPSLGRFPCHLALSPNERLLAAANYGSGDVTLIKLAEDGRFAGSAKLVTHAGRSIDPERQAGPHAHWVGFTDEGRLLYVVDLGADEVWALRLDPSTGEILEKFTAFQAEAGFGPRHLALHPHLPKAYLAGELANAVQELTIGRTGCFEPSASHATLPADFKGDSQLAHIAVNRSGERLYLSNRGHNSIAVFEIDAAGGLALRQIAPSGGDWPRHFHLAEDQDQLIVAHQRSNELHVLALMASGELGPAMKLCDAPSPAFVGEVA